MSGIRGHKPDVIRARLVSYEGARVKCAAASVNLRNYFHGLQTTLASATHVLSRGYLGIRPFGHTS